MKEKEFTWIAEKIAEILNDINNTALQQKIKAEVAELGKEFPVYDKAIF